MAFAQTMQRAREMAMKSIRDATTTTTQQQAPTGCRNPLQHNDDDDDDDNATTTYDSSKGQRFFGCGRQVGVEARFAECLLVTAEVYEQVFGAAWSKDEDDNKANQLLVTIMIMLLAPKY